jgi:hypothetical protein
MVKLRDTIEISKKQISFCNLTPLNSSTFVIDKIIDEIINGLDKDIRIA